MVNRCLVLFALLSILILMNAACSDDEAGPVEPDPHVVPTVELSGTVALPAGYGGDPAALSVKNGVETAGCGGDGAFELSCYEDLAQFAMLLGPGGAPLYLGWLSSGDTELSGRSTAEVLAWLGLGAWMLPNGDADYVRDVLADPATDLSALAAAVDAQVLVNPDGFTSPNAAIGDALAGTVGALLTKAGVDADKNLIVLPDSTMSGVAVNYRGGLNSITIANAFRRRAVAYVWRMSYDTETEESIPFGDEEPLATLEVLPAAAASVAPGSLGEALAGDVSYASLELPPLETPHYAGSELTHYAVNVLGFGAEPPESPGDYTAGELEQGRTIATRGLIQDLFLPLVFRLAVSSIPADDVDAVLGEDAVATMLDDFTALAAAELTGYEQAVTVDRDWWAALGILSEGVAANATVGAGAWSLIDAVLTGLHYTPADIDGIFGTVSDLFDFFDLPAVVDSHLDVTAVGAQLGACKEAETWEITVSPAGVSEPATIHIEPGTSEIGYYTSQTLDLIVDTPPIGLPEDGVHLYEWSCAGTCGTLINPYNEADSSNTFRTASAQVRYVADRAVEGTELITCDMYVQVGTSDILVGDTDAEVEVFHIDYEVTLPDSLFICPNDDYTFSPAFEPVLDPDIDLNYNWSCGGSAGTLEGPDGMTNTWSSPLPDANYNAGPGGTDTVELIVSYDNGTTFVPLDTASVHIEVDEPVVYYGETIGEVWFDPSETGHRYWVYVYFDKVPGFTRYHVDGTGFNDPLWYGDHHWFTGPPWPYASSSIETETWVKVFLTGGSSSGYPAGTGPSEQEILEGPMGRFEGAVWEVTPLCE